MSSVVAQFDPANSNTAEFTAPQSAANGALVFFNESQNSLTLTFADKSNMYLPAWYHRHKCGASGSVNIQWDIHTTLNSGSPPMSLMIVEAFGGGEHFPADGPLMRQANGNVNSTVSGTNAIVNTGNPPGTAIINVTPSDAVLPTWTADNSGNLAINGDNAGVLTTLLQLVAGASPAVKLAAVGLLTQILGGAQVDEIIPFSGDSLQLKSQSGTTQVAIADTGITLAGILEIINATTARIINTAGGDFSFESPINTQVGRLANNGAFTATKLISDSHQNVTTGDTINFLDANGDIMAALVDNLSAAPTVTGNGLFKASKVLFNIGGIKDINKGSFAASGTINHGLTGTPTNVLLCPSSGGSTWTFGASGFTSTQFTATINSALNTNWTAYR